MSLKHAILGFLSSAPMSGYDLKQAFDRSIRHFWPANQSQIYRELADLKRNGFVEQEIDQRKDRLDRKVYHITDSGQSELHQWLSTPLPQQDYRDKSLIQIYFGGMLADSEIITLLKREIAGIETVQAQFVAIYDQYSSLISRQVPNRILFCNLLTLEYGISNNQATLNWLRSALQRIENEAYLPAKLEDLVGPDNRIRS